MRIYVSQISDPDPRGLGRGPTQASGSSTVDAVEEGPSTASFAAGSVRIGDAWGNYAEREEECGEELAELGIPRWPAWLQKGEERGEKRRCWSGKVGLAEVACPNRAARKRSRSKHTHNSLKRRNAEPLQAK